MKRILIFIIILALAALAFAVPYYLRKKESMQIEPRIQTEINGTQTAVLKNQKTPAKPAQKTATAAKNAGYAVSINDFAFSPKTIAIKTGDIITWTNNDNIGHTVTSDNGNGPNSSLLKKGGKYSFIFKTAGIYQYYCAPHPWMKGSVTVTK